MAEVGLQGSRVGALVRKLKAAGVPEHVGVRLKAEAGCNAQPGDHLAPPRSRKGRGPLGHEQERRWRILFAFEAPKRPQFDAAQGVNGWRAVLGSAHMDLPMAEVDGVPAQRHKFDRAEAMAVGQKHHGGVAMAVAVVASGLHELPDLGVGEVFPGTCFGVRPAPRRLTARLDCPINGGQRNARQVRFCH